MHCTASLTIACAPFQAAQRRKSSRQAVQPAAHRGPQLPTRSKSSQQSRSRARAMPVVLSAAQVQAKSVSGRMAELREQGRCAFIPFLVACDPDGPSTVAALRALDEAGADVIELGVPYSDPLADGPTIQAASTRALQKGTTLDKVLAVVAEASPTINAPIVMFTYFNPIMARGLDTFCSQAKAAGASGLLVPDIPLEETDEIARVAASHGLELVLLCTPTTPQKRMQQIAERSQGFVYLVSVTGVTGEKASMEARVEGLIKQLRDVTDKSVAVGFGVSGPEQAQQIKEWGAQGVIVGSALVKTLGEAPSKEEGLERMLELAKRIRAAI